MRTKIIIVGIIVTVLVTLVVASFKVPIYKATAVTCSENAYHRKSIYRGDSKEEIKKEVDELNAAMNLRFCGASGEIRYELFMF